MIYVTLGTQDKEFPRLLEAVEKLDLGDEEIIAQVGSTQFKSKKMKVYKYVSQERHHEYMKKARCIITHAGVGTILEGLKLHKKMIVAARLKKFGEHVNDHQLQLLETFAEDRYILPLYDFEKLGELIERDFTPQEYKSNNKYFNKQLFKTIEGF